MMGFKCPNCKAEFGRDKAAFDRHLNNNKKCRVAAWNLWEKHWAENTCCDLGKKKECEE